MLNEGEEPRGRLYGSYRSSCAAVVSYYSRICVKNHEDMPHLSACPGEDPQSYRGRGIALDPDWTWPHLEIQQAELSSTL